MRKVSEDEINALYKFTRQHYVEYYDVQTELVDHLANGIETQWQENAGMPFEEALQREFKKFGVYGFSDVVGKRVEAMQKKYFKVILKETYSLFEKPSIFLSIILLFFACFFFLKLEQGLDYITYLIFGYLIVLIIALYRRSTSLKKKKRTGGKIFLLEAVIFNAGGYLTFFWFPFHLIHLVFDSKEVGNVYVQILLASFFSLLVVISFICFYHLPKKTDEILQKSHPEIKYLQ